MLVWFKTYPGESPGFKEEGRLLSRQVDVVVILEFRQRKEVCSVVLSLIDEYPKVLLQFLIDPLRLSITLRVIGSGGRYLNPKYAVQLPSEFCYELQTLVGDYLAGYAMEFPNMLDKQPGHTCC